MSTSGGAGSQDAAREISRVGNDMAKGAVWTLLQRLAVRSLSLVSTAVLARVLTPEHFGVVAMALAVIAMIELFTDLRLDVALIKDRAAGRREYDTVFTLNLIMSMGVAAAVALMAGPAAAFYDEARIETVLYVVALSPLIDGLRNVGCVDFRKHFQFHREFQLEFWRKLAGILTTLPLAWVLRSYWALIIGSLVGSVVYVALSYRMHPYRPRLSLAARAAMMHFSGWMVLRNALDFLRLRGAHFVIGRLGGAPALGTFTIAYEASQLPSSELVAPINRAVLPGYSRLAADRAAMQWGLLRVLGLIALVALPAAAGVAVLAELLVLTLYGSQWVEAIVLVQLLAVFGATASLESNLFSAYLALGKTRMAVTRPAIVVAILLPLLFVLMHRYGLVGAAVAYVIAGAVSLPINYQMVLKLTGTSWSLVAAAVARPLAGATVMAVVVASLLPRDAGSFHSMQAAGWLLLLSATGAAVYVAVVLSLWWVAGRPSGAESAVLDKVRPALAALVSQVRTRLSG